jgi:hypothetical protein
VRGGYVAGCDVAGLVCGYIGSLPSGCRGSGGCRGEQPGAEVVPPGSGLVSAPPQGPAQVEGEAGAGDQPGGVLPGQAFYAGGLGDGELDGADAGRAGLPAAGGDGRVAERDAQVSVADVVFAVVACADGGAWVAARSRRRLFPARSGHPGRRAARPGRG